MRCTGFSIVSLVSVLVASATAGDFAEDIRRDFQMGLLPRQVATNLQTFTSALGGASAAPITQSTDPKRPFEVAGDTFTDFASAADRACDNQKNDCANIANSQKDSTFKVSDCDQQDTDCKSAASTATTTSFATLTSSSADFDFFCES
ncbi:hypothetical protein BJ170DRAFT_307455 [Xylariales sp. AK1849]|nr:hypothetical protein BJ170DRAFT_307455 [Xylariales sp. AK1849]